jgi:hypothetical protein
MHKSKVVYTEAESKQRLYLQQRKTALKYQVIQLTGRIETLKNKLAVVHSAIRNVEIEIQRLTKKE